MHGAKADIPARLPDLLAPQIREAVLPQSRTTCPQSETPAVLEIKELTTAIRRGDVEAFSHFYDLYSLRLYRQLLLLSKGNENEAREVLQSVVIKLSRRFEVFEDENRLWAWLRRLVHNAYLDHYRALRRRDRFVPLEGIGVELAGAELVAESWRDCLRDVLEQLASEDRELVRAAYVDKCSLQELANQAGQSYKAIESRLARLRKKLKTRLLIHLRHERSK